jgi:hypothetical protein
MQAITINAAYSEYYGNTNYNIYYDGNKVDAISTNYHLFNLMVWDNRTNNFRIIADVPGYKLVSIETK